jgi:hypothetical protein
MADIKFSCPGCGQHISCGEAWAGHQTECPACHSNVVVPQIPEPSPVRVQSVPTREGSKILAPKLAAGVTQVARSTAPAPVAARKFIPRPPRTGNWVLKYSVMLVVVVALGWAGYFYGLPMVTNALPQEPSSSPPASSTGGGRGGPLGEVNEAMDISGTLDGGSSPKPRLPPATNHTASPRTGAPRR